MDVQFTFKSDQEVEISLAADTPREKQLLDFSFQGKPNVKAVPQGDTWVLFIQQTKEKEVPRTVSSVTETTI